MGAAKSSQKKRQAELVQSRIKLSSSKLSFDRIETRRMLTDETASLMSTSSAEEEEEPTSHAIENVNDFKDCVKKMCQLQDEIKVIAANRKAINDEVNAIKEEVKVYMIENNVKVCNYDTDELFVNRRIKAGSLTRASLRAALQSHFGEESRTATDAFDYIINELGTQEVLELKRAKRKAEPKPKAVGGAKKPRITNKK